MLISGDLSRGRLYQTDKMICSAVTSWPLSPATPVIAHWAHEQSGCGGAVGGYAWGRNSQVQPVYSHWWMANIWEADGISVDSPVWHTPMGIINPLSGRRLIMLDHFHHGRDSTFFFFFYVSRSLIWICFPCMKNSAKITHGGEGSLCLELGDPLENLLILLYPTIKVSGKL